MGKTYKIKTLPKAQLGLIKSPFNLPADVKHPMQLPSKKPVKKPTRTYDPLVDNKPQKSETTQKTAAYSENIGEQQLRGAELRERAAKMMAEKDAQMTGIDYNTALANATKAVQSSDFNPGEYIQREYKKDIGSGPASETVVKESTAPQSYASRAWDIVTNPQAAFEYAVRTGDFRNMPHNYNAMLMAGIDPSAGQGSNLVGDALNSSLNLFDAGDKVVRNVGEGNYLNAAMQGLRFLPSNGLVGNVLGRERGLLGATKYYKPAAISKEQALANLANEYKVNRYFDAVDDPGSFFGNLQSSDALPVNLFNNSIADVIKYKQLSKAVQKGIDPKTGKLNAAFRFNDYPVLRQEWAKRVANEQGLPLNLNYENRIGQGAFGSVYPTTIDENLLVKIGEEPGHETLQSLQSLVDLGKEYSDKSHIALPLSTVKIKNLEGPELRTLKVMNRVPGEPGVPLDPSREAVERFISDVEDLQSKGVSYDFMNPQNMMYDPTTDRFSLIDLGTKHPDPNSRWARAISHDAPGAARKVMRAKFPQVFPEFDQGAKFPYTNPTLHKSSYSSLPKLPTLNTRQRLKMMLKIVDNMEDFDFQEGGAVMDLTPEQIKLYKDAGYVIMEEGGTSEPPIKTLPEVTVRPKSLGHIVDKRPEYAKGYYDPWGVSDNTLENIVEIFDPTGVSSWDDVVRAEREFGKDSWQANLERLGAIPLVGKAAKTLKGLRGVPMTARQARSYKTTVKGLQGISKLGRGSDAYQAVDEFGTGGSYVDDQITHFQNGDTVPPVVQKPEWYQEPNINPSAFVSGYRGGEEPNTYNYGFLNNAGPGQLIGGAGLGIPKYGVDANVTGIVPTSPEEMQYFKGVYGANLSKQFKDVNLGLGVNTAITGYPGEEGFVRDPMSFEPRINFRYNFQDGGLNKRIVKRYPGMQSVYGPQGENLNIIKDPSFSPRDTGIPYGDIEFIHPGTGKVTYFAEDPANDIVYQSPTPDKYTAVYNPKGANKHDVFLDMMHGMRNDPEYMNLLQNFASQVKTERQKEMDHWYNYDVQNYDYGDGREGWDDNYIDGLLRAHLAKKGMGRRSFGAKDYKLERKGSSPEMRKSANEIYKYLKGKQDGGRTLDPGNNALELHMFYDKTKFQKGGKTFQPGQIYTFDDNPNVYYKLNDSGNVVVKNKQAGSNQYVAMNDPEGTRRKTLEYGLTTGKTNLYGTPEQYAEYTDPNLKSTINDFMYSKAEAQSEKMMDRTFQCFKDAKGNCAGSAFLYYDKYVAPKLPGGQTSWQIKEGAGMSSGAKGVNPAFDKVGASWDSWDIAAGLLDGGGKLHFTAKDNNNRPINQKLAGKTQAEIEQFWRDMKLPIGTIVNGGGADNDDYFQTMSGEKGLGYNTQRGLTPSNHTTIVVGYDAYGTPYLYDEGAIVSIADSGALVNEMGITNIITPKQNLGYTFDKIKSNKNFQDKPEKLKLTTPGLGMVVDQEEFKPFKTALEKNKESIMNVLDMSNDQYDEYAVRALATALTETKGGNDWTSRYGIVPTYTTDKLGLGESTGITQINPKSVWAEDKSKKKLVNTNELVDGIYVHEPEEFAKRTPGYIYENGKLYSIGYRNQNFVDKLNQLGINESNYDPWNPEHQAIVTIGLLKENQSTAMDNLKKNKGNKQTLDPAAVGYYQWNQPSLLAKGEAFGESENVKRFMTYYDLLKQYNKQDGGSTQYLTQEEIDNMRAQGYYIIED